jgi:hypothetical protein
MFVHAIFHAAHVASCVRCLLWILKILLPQCGYGRAGGGGFMEGGEWITDMVPQARQQPRWTKHFIEKRSPRGRRFSGASSSSAAPVASGLISLFHHGFDSRANGGTSEIMGADSQGIGAI